MHLALHSVKASRMFRVADFINAVGTIAHHGAASLLMCMLLSDVVPPARQVLNPCLILVAQHWFVLLRYVSIPLYFGIVFLLEIWFEWTIFSDFQYYISLHWTASQAASVMLAAHWMYLSTALLGILRCGPPRSVQ